MVSGIALGIRTQTPPQRTGALPDHRPSRQRPTGQAPHRTWRRTAGRRRGGGSLLWTLDTLAESAREMGIEIGRSQVRRTLLAEGVRWRNTRPWAESACLRSSPQRSQIVELYTSPPPGSTVVCVDELGSATPRFSPPAPGWSPDGHRIKAPLEYGRGPYTRRGC